MSATAVKAEEGRDPAGKRHKQVVPWPRAPPQAQARVAARLGRGVVGAIGIASALTPEFANRYDVVKGVLPPGVPTAARVFALAFGIALVWLSRSLARRKQRAWQLAVVVVDRGGDRASREGPRLRGVDDLAAPARGAPALAPPVRRSRRPSRGAAGARDRDRGACATLRSTLGIDLRGAELPDRAGDLLHGRRHPRAASRRSASGCGRCRRRSRRRWGSGASHATSSRSTAATASPSSRCGATRASSSRRRGARSSRIASCRAPRSSAAILSATRRSSTRCSPSSGASPTRAAGGLRSSVRRARAFRSTSGSACARSRSATRRC